MRYVNQSPPTSFLKPMIITRETKKTILKTIRKLRATPLKKNVPKNGTRKIVQYKTI